MSYSQLLSSEVSTWTSNYLSTQDTTLSSCAKRTINALLETTAKGRNSIFCVPDAHTAQQCIDAISICIRNAAMSALRAHETETGNRDLWYGVNDKFREQQCSNWSCYVNRCMVDCRSSSVAADYEAAESAWFLPVVVVSLFNHSSRREYGSEVNDSIRLIELALKRDRCFIGVTPLLPDEIKPRIDSLWNWGARLNPRYMLLKPE